ncbi:hypothetical protein [Hymenobacter rubripertinctus]|nr:hypothetical protein [Hymenobacter rubripertinctus]
MAAAVPARRQDAMMQNSQAYVLRDTNAVYVVIKIPLAKEPTLAPTFEARKSYYTGRAIPLMLGTDYPNLLEQSVTEQDGVDIITVKHKVINADGALVI